MKNLLIALSFILFGADNVSGQNFEYLEENEDWITIRENGLNNVNVYSIRKDQIVKVHYSSNKHGGGSSVRIWLADGQDILFVGNKTDDISAYREYEQLLSVLGIKPSESEE